MNASLAASTLFLSATAKIQVVVLKIKTTKSNLKVSHLLAIKNENVALAPFSIFLMKSCL